MSTNPDVVVIGGGPAGSTVSTLMAQQGLQRPAVRTRAFSPLSYRRIAHPGDLLGSGAVGHAREDEEQPLRQEAQRAVRERQRQAVGAVLLLGQQAARVLANLAGRPQRVRSDDARERPRARRGGPRGCAGDRRFVRRRAGRRHQDPERQTATVREVRGQGGRRCQRPERIAAAQVQTARLGSRAEQGRHLDLLGRAPTATPGATKAPRW